MNIHTFWDNNKWGKKMEKYYEHVNEILVTYNDKFKQQLMNELREYNIDIVESTNKIIRYSCKSFVDILNLINQFFFSTINLYYLNSILIIKMK